MTLLAVEALKKIIYDKIRVDVNLNRLWETMLDADADELKNNGWIVNCTMETVRFYVYNSNDCFRLIPAQIVDAQPGEKVEVHGGYFQKKQNNMLVYKENKGTAYNVKKNYLHFWTGAAMTRQGSSMEHFRNQYSHGISRKWTNWLGEYMIKSKM